MLPWTSECAGVRCFEAHTLAVVLKMYIGISAGVGMRCCTHLVLTLGARLASQPSRQAEQLKRSSAPNYPSKRCDRQLHTQWSLDSEAAFVPCRLNVRIG